MTVLEFAWSLWVLYKLIMIHVGLYYRQTIPLRLHSFVMSKMFMCFIYCVIVSHCLVCLDGSMWSELAQDFRTLIAVCL